MPWMTGGGQPIPAGLSYPPPMIFEQAVSLFCETYPLIVEK